MPRCLTDPEAREYLKCSVRTWSKIKKDGLVRPLPLTGAYLKSDLKKLVKKLAAGRDNVIKLEITNDGQKEEGREVPGEREDKRDPDALLQPDQLRGRQTASSPGPGGKLLGAAYPSTVRP